MKNRIILGTVQLGMPYGINNSSGKPSIAEAFAILDYAHAQGITTLDSADVYGDALQVIGDYKHNTGVAFRVINKFKVDHQPLPQKLMQCLELLQASSLHCYMYHQYDDYESGIVQKHLDEAKEKGYVEKIGISIYNSHQLEKVYDDTRIDIIQLPVNILDLDDHKRLLLDKAHNLGKEIHARSIFLQGLFLKSPDSLTGNIVQLRPYVEQLKRIADSHSIDLKGAALNFVLNQPFIDALVIGVEMKTQLRENLTLVNPDIDTTVFNKITIRADHRHLLNPANWKL